MSKEHGSVWVDLILDCYGHVDAGEREANDTTEQNHWMMWFDEPADKRLIETTITAEKPSRSTIITWDRIVGSLEITELFMSSREIAEDISERYRPIHAIHAAAPSEETVADVRMLLGVMHKAGVVSRAKPDADGSRGYVYWT